MVTLEDFIHRLNVLQTEIKSSNRRHERSLLEGKDINQFSDDRVLQGDDITE